MGQHTVEERLWHGGAADVIARLPTMGLEQGTLSADEFAAYYRSEVEKYARVVKGAGIPAMD